MIIILFSSLINSYKCNSFAKPESKTTEYKSIQDSLNYYYELGDKNFYQGYYFNAENNYLKYLRLLQKYYPNDNRKFADIYITLGVINSIFWKFNEAIELYNKAEILCNNSPSFNKTLGRIYYSKGKIYKRIGDYEKAIQYYENSLNLFKLKIISETDKNELKDLFNRVIYAYNSLGVLYYELKDYKKALNYFKKCAELSKFY